MKRTYIGVLRTVGPFMALLLLLSSCSVQFSIDQPGNSEPDSIFTVPISYAGWDGYGPPSPVIALFGIQLPMGWAVEDSILMYDSLPCPPGNIIGHMVYSQALTDTMNLYFPVDAGHYWWVGQSASPVPCVGSGLVSIDPPDTTGSFVLGYFGGTSMFDPDEYVFIKNVNITMGLPDTQFVTTNANTGAGSLRWAVEHVSHNGVVRCNLGQQDTIKLTESIEIYSGLTIDGGPNTTPISGNDSCTVFVIDGYDNTPTLQNLLITGGKGIDGGGILCLGYSSLILNHVELSQNLAERGAAICADYPWEYMNWISDIGNMRNMRLRNVLIRDNNASQNGGGVYASNGRLDIETSIIANNQAVQGAGGLSINHCPARIINSLITGNSSMAAGGISSTAYDSVSVINTTIADNHSASNAAGGLDFGYKDDFNGSLIRIENTIFCGNYNTQGPASIGMSTTNPLQATKVNLSHCNFPSGSTIGNLPVTVSSCIYSPPLFDSLSADHPYALLPSSPCIDAGINPVDPDFPATDIVGNKRIFDGDNNGEKVIDIGAYEFDPVWAGMNENPDWVSSFMLVKIYPNPCNVVANLQVKPSERGHIILKLYDINGKELWTRYFDTEPAEVFIRQIDMSSYHPGIYLLEIDNGSEKVLKKLVVY